MTTSNMYEQMLNEAGLSQNQAIVYETLLKEGILTAGSLAGKTPIKRSLIYKILDELLAKNLIDKQEPAGKVAVFSAKHPSQLRDLVNAEEAQVARAKAGLEQLLPQLTSAFNLAAGRPGVRFFEGKEGIRKVWWDSFETDGEIYTYGDLEAIMRDYTDLNDEYFKERKKRGIKKKFITNDNEANRRFMAGYDTTITEYRMIRDVPMNFSSVVMHIYKNKISYTTLSGDTMIGVIIEDKLIYEMQKSLFEATWQILEKQTADTKPKSMYDMSA